MSFVHHALKDHHPNELAPIIIQTLLKPVLQRVLVHQVHLSYLRDRGSF